jgi:hypothetical protein
MARRKADPADAVAALLDSVAARPANRRGRPKASKITPKPAAAAPGRRMGRPKGSKNKPKATVAPAVSATTVVPAAPKPIVRRRRRRARIVEQTLGQRVDSMIAELTKLRSEVGQLERLRDVLKAINVQ